MAVPADVPDWTALVFKFKDDGVPASATSASVKTTHEVHAWVESVATFSLPIKTGRPGSVDPRGSRHVGTLRFC